MCFYYFITEFGKVAIYQIFFQCEFKTSHKPYESNSESKFIKMSKKRHFQTVFSAFSPTLLQGVIIKNHSFILIDLILKIFFTPYFKDPMRFLFWTFLDILKMSIFQLFEIIFFCRTEKSGYKYVINCRSINSKKFLNIFSRNFGFFENPVFKGPIFGHFYI